MNGEAKQDGGWRESVYGRRGMEIEAGERESDVVVEMGGESS